MRWRILTVAAATTIAACGCARNPDRVVASYVSPVLYQSLTCEQLGIEATRVSSRAAVATGQQGRQATTDKVMTGVGVVLFWPALFFIGGDDAQTAELARLKGEMDAIEQTSIAKNCGIQFQRTGPASPPPATPVT